MSYCVAVDCMGGDFGPSVTVPAVMAFLRRFPEARVVLVGDNERVAEYLPGADSPDLARIRRVHASQVVGMDEPPAQALRGKKDSSMRVAINLVKDGEAHACLSAGNTGALMAIARFVLKTLPGIDRPAICSILPTVSGHVHVLDLGANVDCTAEHLLQFGIMGAMLASAVDHKDRPTVGIVNIGEEDIKGNEVVKEASELLRQSGLNFIGNVEGDGVYRGEADVVVCDGFVGNVLLKTAEGVAQMFARFLKEAFTRNPLTKAVGLAAKPVLAHLKQRVDHRRYNGASLLGLRGIVIKSHGSADAYAFEQALVRAYEAARNNVPARISDRVAEFTQTTDKPLEGGV